MPTLAKSIKKVKAGGVITYYNSSGIGLNVKSSSSKCINAHEGFKNERNDN